MKLTAQRLLVFKSAVCSHCEAMDKAKVVEKFTAKNFPPKIPVTTLVCLNEEGEVPAGSDFEKAFKVSDGYGINAFPTVVFEGRRKDGSAFEIARADGSTVSDFSLKEFLRVYRDGMEQVEEMPDDIMTQDEAAKTIPW